MSGAPELVRTLRSSEAAADVVEAIRRIATGLGEVRLMEVCGTHTTTVRRSGIPSLLPPNVTLLSGPGCPVCVTPNAAVDLALALAAEPGITLATFGDMVRVPGSRSSLAAERAAGADVRVVYSPLDAVRIASALPQREVVFLGVGFETTAPAVASAVIEASESAGNFSVLACHKLVPPALEALASSPSFSVDGFIMPGHVSAIIGADAYRPLAARHGMPCVIAGFEPGDVLLAVLMLLGQIREGRAEVEIEYRAAVRPEGNRHAIDVMNRVFVPADGEWRGIGSIPASGLEFGPEFIALDASSRHRVSVEPPLEHPGCRCGQVLAGALQPPDCSLFGRSCTPDSPVGPCMVSSEGACAAWYRYGT